LEWNGKPIKGIRFFAGKAKAQIAIPYGAESVGEIESSGTDMNENQFTAYKKAKLLLAKAILLEIPCGDILSFLEAEGWEVFPI
jgi:hypothetical protein